MFVFQRPANVAVFDEQTLTDRSEKLVEDAAFLTSFRFISLASLNIALIIHTISLTLLGTPLDSAKPQLFRLKGGERNAGPLSSL